MAKEVLKSWGIGVAVTLLVYVLVTVTPLGLAWFFFLPFILLAEYGAVQIAGGSSMQTPLVFCLVLLLGGIYYGVIALIVLRFRARQAKAAP